MRNRHSPSKEKEALNFRQKGTQKQVDTNIMQHIQQVAEKKGTNRNKG